MPFADSDGVSIYYEASGDESRAGGSGESTSPVVLLADAGYGAWQWSWQYPALSGQYEIVVPNTRGTGESDAPKPTTSATYDVGAMARDVEAVLSEYGARNAHLVGAGLGGMVALQYALDFSRAKSLCLLATSPGDPRTDSISDEMRDRLLADPDDLETLRESLKPVASDELLETDELVERIVSWRRDEDATRAVQQAHLDAVADFDVSDRLYEITVPALVVHGSEDRVVPVEDGRLLADGLPNGDFREFPGEHLVFVERSKAVNDAVVGFLETLRD